MNSMESGKSTSLSRSLEIKTHAGHRERLRRRALMDGAEALRPHELLELLLFYAIPRRDVNALAHELDKRFGGVCGVLAADEAALARVFQNLLQNAGRYAKSRLVITAGEKPEQLLLTFANDTTDLSPSDTARLFERFYTPDASRHQGSEKGQGGTGLGLTVARTLAREMQGDLSAELTPTRDTEGILCFTLSLKRA